MRALSPSVFGALALAGLAIIVGLYVFFTSTKVEPGPTPTSPAPTTTAPTVKEDSIVVGRSVKGRAIEAYTFGEGKTHLLFVGGMHGGYEWNSVVLAYQFIDYLKQDPAHVPDGVTISVIPSANPDGVYEVIGKEGRFAEDDVPDVSKKPTGYGRLNAHKVDLNRNFACHWQPKSMWRGTAVSAGTSTFSEPEAATIRDFVLRYKPASVVFWHSQSGSVYASECGKGILPDTLSIMNVYAKAAGYTAVKSFDAYAITGDSEGWLASIGIPAVTVELKTHLTVEWKENLAGIKALLEFYSKK